MRLKPAVPLLAPLVLVLTGLLAPLPVGAVLPNFGDLDGVLLRNVRNGYVDYDGIGADPAFHRFITAIGESRPGDFRDRDEELAFLINAYNALAIQGILDGHSPATRLGRQRLFRQQKFRVLGEELSLDELKDRNLTPMGEPRIHFAIVCPSLYCPRLASRAYQPDTLALQLDAAVRAFVNDPTRNRFDPDRRIALLSPVLASNRGVFEGAAGSLQAYLGRYAADETVAEILRTDGFELRFMDQDWDLNGSRRSRAR